MSGLFTIRRRKRLKSERHIRLCLESLVKCFPPFFFSKKMKTIKNKDLESVISTPASQ